MVVDCFTIICGIVRNETGVLVFGVLVLAIGVVQQEE